MTDSLETGSHLCDGCVTDASKLTGPGPWADVVPGQQPREDTAIRACRRWSCVAVRLTPPGRTATQTIPARPCRTRWAAYRLSAPAPDLSGAVAFPGRPGACLQAGRY